MLQDVATSLLLAEAVYKALDDISAEEAVAEIQAVAAQLPPELRQNLNIQWSLPHVTHRCEISLLLWGHEPTMIPDEATNDYLLPRIQKFLGGLTKPPILRYLLAEGEESIYISFMGTKIWRDLLANAAVLQEPLWAACPLSLEVSVLSPEAENEAAISCQRPRNHHSAASAHLPARHATLNERLQKLLLIDSARAGAASCSRRLLAASQEHPYEESPGHGCKEGEAAGAVR